MSLTPPYQVHHYTTPQSYERMLSGWLKRGWKPHSQMNDPYRSARNKEERRLIRRSVTYGLLAQDTFLWQHNHLDKYIWDKLMFKACYTGKTSRERETDKRVVLVEFEVFPEDKAEVWDYAWVPITQGKPLLFHPENVEGGHLLGDRLKLQFRQYWNSRQPIQAYQPGTLHIPEVVLPGTIPKERITVVWEKNLEELLQHDEKMSYLFHIGLL